MSEATPKVAVIMRSKNSDWVIGETLEALYSQNFKDFETLVVDSGSTDRTLEIVSRYPVRLIEIEARAYYPGVVLNMAIEKTQSEVVVFVNSDSVAQTPDALGNLVAAFDDPSVQAAFARQTPRPEAKSWVLRDYAESFPPEGDAPPWITLSLPMAGMRRSIWEKHPFYTDAWASEDTEWGHWAKTEGHIVRYVPHAVVMHSHNYTFRQLYGRRFVEGEADAFIYGRKETIATMTGKWIRHVLQDWAWCVRSFNVIEILSSPFRRFVYCWAYLKGHKLGEARIAKGDRDASHGQEVILERQD